MPEEQSGFRKGCAAILRQWHDWYIGAGTLHSTIPCRLLILSKSQQPNLWRAIYEIVINMLRSPRQINQGVTQGSVLGLFGLFTIFTLKLHTAVVFT